MSDHIMEHDLTTEEGCRAAFMEYEQGLIYTSYSDFKDFYCQVPDEPPPLTYPEYSGTEILDEIAAAIEAAAAEAQKSVEKFLEFWFGDLGTLLYEMIEGVNKTFAGIANWIEYDINSLNQAIAGIESSIKSTVEAISHDLEDTLAFLAGEVSHVYKKVGEHLEDVYEGVKEAIISAYDLTLAAFKEALSYANAQTSGIFDAIATIIKAVATVIGAAITAVGSLMETVFTTVGVTITGVVEEVAGWIVTGIEAVGEWITGILDAVMPVIEDLLEQLLKLIRPLFEWLSESIDIDTSSLTDAIASFLEPLAKMQIELSENLSKRLLFPEGEG